MNNLLTYSKINSTKPEFLLYKLNHLNILKFIISAGFAYNFQIFLLSIWFIQCGDKFQNKIHNYSMFMFPRKTLKHVKLNYPTYDVEFHV